MPQKEQPKKKRLSPEARALRIQRIMFAVLALVVVASMLAALVANP